MCVPFGMCGSCKLVEWVFGTVAIVISGGYTLKYLILTSELGHYPTVMDMLRDEDFLAITSRHVMYGLCVLFGIFMLAAAVQITYKSFCGCICSEDEDVRRRRKRRDESANATCVKFSWIEFLMLWFTLNCVLLLCRRVFRSSVDEVMDGILSNTTSISVNGTFVGDFITGNGGPNEFDVADLVIVCATTLATAVVLIVVKVVNNNRKEDEDDSV